MVERLKAAIEKARERRSASPGGGDAAWSATALAPSESWERLPQAELDPAVMTRERIVSFSRGAQNHLGFDILRTRLLKVCIDNGWRRIGITSPTKGCGKTVVACNLAFSLARAAQTRSVLIDLDLRSPRVAPCLGVRTKTRIASYLSGETALEDVFVRFEDRLAFGLNTFRERNAAELLQSPETAAAIARMMEALKPNIALFDVPPMLVADDTIGFLGNLDGVILVAAAGQTTAQQLEECNLLLDQTTAHIGVVLNKCADNAGESYSGYEAT